MEYRPRSRKFAYYAILGLFFASLSASASTRMALAEERNPYRAAVEIKNLAQILEPTLSTLALSQASTPEREAISPVHVKARIRGQGIVDIRLAVKRNINSPKAFRINGREVSDTLNPTLLQGLISIGGSIGKTSSARLQPTALSVINNKLRLSFLGRAKGSKGRQRLYTLHTKLRAGSASEVHVSSLPATALKRGGCDSSVEDIHGERQMEHHITHAIGQEVSAQATALSRVVTLSTDADPEWFARFGTESNAEIARIINSAEAIFFRNFGITFHVAKQHTYTDSSPYDATNASFLLSQFVGNPENPTNLSDTPESFATSVDVKHLFSGRDFDGNTLGVAYIGAVCASPQLAYGVTQYYLYDTTAGIFTHELSHNFGAYHDTADRSSIMYPSISVPPSHRFSDVSKREIKSFISNNARCMSLAIVDRSDAPAPSPDLNQPQNPLSWSLTIRRQRTSNTRSIKFTGSLIAPDGSGVANEVIELYIKEQLVATTSSDSNGKFSFKISSKSLKNKGVEVYASTEDGSATSAIIKVSPIVSRSRTRR